MTLGDFYMSLLPFDAVDLNIKGYTETLSLFKGSVRIVTASHFCDVPANVRRYFFNWNSIERGWENTKIIYPAYMIPIHKDKEVYGFILKGSGKMTSHISTWINCFNLDSLFGKESYVIGVEGIKDCYPFLIRRHPCIAVLTSKPNKDLLEFIKSIGKKFIYIADNDDDKKINTGQQVRIQLQKEMNYMKMRFVLPGLKEAGDTGEYFDSEEKKIVIERFIDKVESYI